MLKKYLLILLPLLWLNIVYSVKLNSITPEYVDSDFSSKIEKHELIANVTLGVKETKSLMMFIGDIDLDYDRELPNENHIYCVNQENKLVTDFSRQENYLYSCCSFKNDDKYGNSLFQCPIPPPEIDPDPFETFIIHKEPILIKTLDNTAVWELSNLELEYKNDFSLGGILKKSLTFIVVSTIVISITLGAISTINLFSNIYPKLFIFLHISSLILLFIVEFFLFGYVFNKKLDKGKFTYLENGLVYSMISIIYSLFIIYIPTTRDINEKKLVDQRIIIRKYQHKILYKIVSVLKHKYTKDLFTLIFIVLTVFQYNSIYSLVHSVRKYFDSEWQVLMSIVISYSILSLLFIISFLTGIYEVKVPIRFNKKTGQMTQIIPLSQQNRNRLLQQASKKVGTNKNINNNFITGLCNNGEVSKLNINTLKEGEIYAIDSDINNRNNPYQYLFWKIGKINDGIIEYDPELKCTQKKRTLRNYYSNNKIILLDYRDEYDKLQLYEVIHMTSDQQISFVNIGYLRKGTLHENHRYILKIIALLFKIIPDYSKEYEYNVVENMRCEWHRMTNSCGKHYGYIYQILFSLVTLGLIVFQFLVRFNITEVLLSLTMIIYTISVNTRKVAVPKLRKMANYTDLLRKLNKTKRDGETLLEYQTDLDWIRSNKNSLANFSNSNYNFGLNWVSINENIEDNIYLEITFERECPLIGLGIGNQHSDNIYDIMSPAIWYSNERGIGIKTAEKITWLEQQYKKSEKLILGIGFIGKQIYFTHFGKTKFLTNYNKENIICCLPPDIYYEIRKYTLPISMGKQGELTYLPPLKIDYQYQLEMNFNLGDNNYIEKISDYDPFETEIGYIDSSHYKYYTLLYNTNNDFQQISGKIPKYKGVSICLNNLEVCLSSRPFQIRIEVILSELEILPKFIAFGLVEKSFTSFKGFMDIVPGWKSSNSIAFHSDDGSICIGNNGNNTQYVPENTSWFSIDQTNKTCDSSIGYDGVSFYIEANNKRVKLLSKYLPDSWLNDVEYIPMIYFNDKIKGNFSIKIQNTI
jgi:hypothetical protein